MADRARTTFASIDPDPEWDLYLLGGTPGRTLVNVARNAHMLVLGAREHTGIGRMLAGSVSHYCLSHSAVPVAAVPAPGEPVAAVEAGEVVVGLDDSPSGDRRAQLGGDVGSAVGRSAASHPRPGPADGVCAQGLPGSQ